jgi:hypothetical protein
MSKISLHAIENSSLSQNSKVHYIRHLKKLVDLVNKPLADIIRNPTETVGLINEYNGSTASKKAMVAGVCALLKHDRDLANEYANAIPKWAAAMKSVNKIERDRVSTMTPTEREISNWVDWKTITQREGQLAKLEYGSDRHMLLALYTHIEPVRCDFGNIELFIGEKPEREKLNSLGVNYMRLSRKKGKSYLVLNTYKTCRKYGCYSRYLPDSLVNIIIQNLEANPRKHLVVSTNGGPYLKRNSYTRYVNSVLSDIFGKNITVSILRHSYISNLDFNALSPKELQRISKNMQHSVGMQQMYRRRVFGEFEDKEEISQIIDKYNPKTRTVTIR